MSACPVDDRGTCTSDVAACTFAGCAAVTGLTDVDPLLDDDERPLDTSPIAFLGRSLAGLSVPTALAADLDAVCRDVNAPDLGALVVDR